MLGIFGKKKQEPEQGQEGQQQEQEPQQQSSSDSDTLSLPQISAELDKLKAQFSSYYEMQKAANERFSRINEQVGELRALLADRDRTAQQLEAKAAKAVDIVSTVQPEKLSIEMQKVDAKVEALRANIEGNETIMQNALSELKDMRAKMGIYRGMEEAVKMFQETKKELSQVKVVESVVQKHADRVDTIFGEMGKSFSDVTKMAGTLKDLDGTTKQLASDLDSFKAKMQLAAQKKEVEDLTTRVSEFEKKVSNVMNLINRKFEEVEKKNETRVNKTLENAEKLLKGFGTLAKKTPDLDKYFNLLSEEAKKAEEKEKVSVEKIKQPGEGEDVVEQAQPKKEEKKKLSIPNPFKKEKK